MKYPNLCKVYSVVLELECESSISSIHYILYIHVHSISRSVTYLAQNCTYLEYAPDLFGRGFCLMRRSANDWLAM
jgi:hypothetical protein